MPSSGMLHRVADVRTEVSEERIANVVPSSPILAIVMMEKIRSYETQVLTRATRHHIPEDGILSSHRRENLTSHIALSGWAL
jgi:hypothetical protein